MSVPSSQRPPLLITGLALALAAINATTSAAPSVSVGGNSYINQGLVGVGRVPAGLLDKNNETHGSFSAFTFEHGTWTRNADGSYSGVLLTQPDRGYNVTATTNYVPRFNRFSLTFRPADGGSVTQDQVALTLDDSVLFKEADTTPMTSLDPTPTGTGTRTGFPALPQAHNNRISLDAEGIISNANGTLWVSDEYGPYIYKFSAEGTLLSAIRPPEAIIPKRGGSDSFASNNPGAGQPAPDPANPTTGRQNNQGMEGLSISPDGKTLFGLLQSAARQDGGTGASGPRRNTRLFAWDITGTEPILTGEWVIQLPTFSSGANTLTAAQSELLAINDTQFLVLARDSNGRGTANPTSLYRAVLLYDIASATNIAGTAFDAPATPIAPGGALDASIKPAAGTVLVDLNDSVELAKFGLTNGPIDSVNNLSEKWEALALVPSLDPGTPDDWFLFVGNDNDFMTTAGFQDGMSYAAAIDNDCMVLVYRITMPSRLLNISSRAQVGSGENVHIAGFVVHGARPKTMLIRAVGPSLSGFGVATALADPVATLFDATRQAVAGNDDWADDADIAAAADTVGAFALSAGSKDAAILVRLAPGSYTLHVSGKGAAQGVALAEVYELP